MRNPEMYNSERYLDMTAFCALENVEKEERRQERRKKMRDDWIYRRGDVYLVDLGSYRGSEQGGICPVVLLQNNVGNLFSSTLIIAPITDKFDKKANQPTHYYAGYIRGLNGSGTVLLEQIKTIDKRRVIKYLGKMSRRQLDGIEVALETSLGLHIPVEMEAP